MGTAAGFFLFTTTTTEVGQLGVSCLSACLANIMYGGEVIIWIIKELPPSENCLQFGLVIYTYTPEVFSANIRGTGTGMASALGRVTGATGMAVTLDPRCLFSIDLHRLDIVLYLSSTHSYWSIVGCSYRCSVVRCRRKSRSCSCLYGAIAT